MSAQQATFLGPGLAALTPSTGWADAAAAFELYMTNQEYSRHTIRSFRSDLRLAGEYLGADTQIGRVSTSDPIRISPTVARETVYLLTEGAELIALR